MARIRIIYMGTPDFAVPALQALAAGDDVEIVSVVTQPDRPAGRGRKPQAPPVKVTAESLGLPLLQTATLRDPAIRHTINDLRPDLIVVAAFGLILGTWILDLPRLGCINLHASLLPKYRGANPIAAAIANGEQETGVTLMRMDRGLDTGDMLAHTSTEIYPQDTTESLTPRLAQLAADLIGESLPLLLAGDLQSQPQPAGATLTRPMTKDDGWLDWSRSADDLERHVRAMWSWPRAWTTMPDGRRLQIHSAAIDASQHAAPGTVVHADRLVGIGTRDGALILRRAQIAGGKPLDGDQLGGLLRPDMGLGAIGAPERQPPLVSEVENPVGGR